MIFGDKKLIQMELRIRRVVCKDTYTIGKLEVLENGVYKRICDTLEDKVRDYNKDGDLLDAGETKVYGQTAIPYGKYEVDMNSISPKFQSREWGKKYKGFVPLIKNVKHFDGIRIHPANKPEDLLGCIGVGINSTVGRIASSTAMYYHLMDDYLIPAKERGETITLEIV